MATGSGVKVNDTILWVEDTGEHDLPVVLCLHSLFLDGRMYDELVAAAAGRYRVVRPDFRGQGRSRGAESDLIDMDTCAADMAGLMDVLELENVNLIVQSAGGDVGFRLVAGQPERFRAFVILGSSARALEGDQLERERQWIAAAGTGGFVGTTLDATMEVMFGRTTLGDPTKQEMLALWRERIAALPLALWPAMNGVIERGDVLPLLPGIPVPSLVFSGDEDVPRPPAWHQEVAEQLPNAKLVRLAQIGHSPILEAPDVVIPEILTFLDDPVVHGSTESDTSSA